MTLSNIHGRLFVVGLNLLPQAQGQPLSRRDKSVVEGGVVMPEADPPSAEKTTKLTV